MPGDDDDLILRRAQTESRILITFDKDFGELAFRSGLPAACGIVLFRIPMNSPDQVARRAVDELGARSDWAGNFVVIERAKVRVRPLP
jgi:predicted nuclease of predicted toxin-antitoxin system